MGEQKKKINLVIRPCSPKLKIAVIALILCSMAALISLVWVRASILREAEELRTEAAALENENADLEEKIDQLGSLESAQEIAEEELGLADPNTVVINPNS